MSAVGATIAPPSAHQKRAEQPLVAAVWGLDARGPRLPLVFPVAAGLPPSPKQRYRSQYRPRESEALSDPARLALLSDFEIVVGLIDFSPLERVLAPLYSPSRKGQVPFHPVSLFLAVCYPSPAAQAPTRAGHNLSGGRGSPHLGGYSPAGSDRIRSPHPRRAESPRVGRLRPLPKQPLCILARRLNSPSRASRG